MSPEQLVSGQWTAMGPCSQFLIDKTMKASKKNTYIVNGEQFPLSSEIPSSGPTIAASIKHHNDIEATLVKGTLLHLWQHNDCPGRHNQGCFRMSAYQGIAVNDSMAITCQLKDATTRPLSKRSPYLPVPRSQDQKLDSAPKPRQFPPHCHCEQTMEQKYHGLR